MANNVRTFVKTETILDKILAHKVEEVTAQQNVVSLNEIAKAAKDTPPARDFTNVLRVDTVALIGEVKKASPSKGILIENFDPVSIGKLYAENGASAISVLTDEQFFQGHLDYLTSVREATSIPVLRKDFILDPYQVYEGRVAGADAILLIVAALEDSQIAELHGLITELDMSALVEVHNEHEVERALKIDAQLIGINNRDLKTFLVDMDTTARLAKLIPNNVTLVAESGIQNTDDVRHMGECGAHAVLVGESLVKADNIARKVQEFSSQPRGKRDDQSQNLRRDQL
jgi:indole-3-glycerol phosphate synthase